MKEITLTPLSAFHEGFLFAICGLVTADDNLSNPDWCAGRDFGIDATIDHTGVLQTMIARGGIEVAVKKQPDKERCGHE